MLLISPLEGNLRPLRPVVLKYLFAILFSIALLQAAAQTDTLHLDSGFTQCDLLEYAAYHTTAKLKAAPADIAALPDEAFTTLANNDGSFFSGPYEYWVKIKLKNSTSHLLSLVAQVRELRTNRVQFFSLHPKGIQASPVMGDELPFEQRVIPHPLYLYPLTIAPNASATLFIRYSKINETLTIDPQLWETTAFAEEDRQESFIFTLALGILLCITATVTLIALVTRKALLLSFALYCIACILMVVLITGYGAMYLWPNTPYWNSVGYFFVILYYLSMTQMAKLYLRIRSHTPWLHQFFTAAQLLLLLVYSPLVLGNPLIGHPIVKIWSGRSGLILLLLLNLALVYSSITTFVKKRAWGALFFLLGFLFSIAAILLFEIEQLLSVNTLWGIELTLLCILLDFIVLIFLFGYQIRHTYDRNARLNQDLNQAKLQAANTLLEGQLEERKRLSQELHDGISIKIALLKMKLSTWLSPKDKNTQELLGAVNQLAEEVRAFTHALSPVSLEQLGLKSALDELASEITAYTGLSIQLDHQDLDLSHLRPQEQHTVYHVVNELLNNTLKHANAQSVSVRLSNSPEFSLIYQDDGVGVAEDAFQNGIGLKNIQDRATLLGGQFTIHSKAGKGSHFEFTF
jgi:signal transduction histidine kinase